MESESNNNMVGQTCPMCSYGLLHEYHRGLLTQTVECTSCGAILPKDMTDDELEEFYS